jgi:hypothetical protein
VLIEENTRTHTKPFAEFFFLPSATLDRQVYVTASKVYRMFQKHSVKILCTEYFLYVSVSGNCPEGPCAECFILSVALESAYA